MRRPPACWTCAPRCLTRRPHRTAWCAPKTMCPTAPHANPSTRPRCCNWPSAHRSWSACWPRRAGEARRHQGIREAQALVALGRRPVWDDAGRPARVETIPADELKRPRVDVLMSITGSYRDQFPALMALLDRAVAQAATAEPGNVIARNTAQIGQELRKQGVPRAQAEQLARVRAFGNAVGDYGTGLQTNDARRAQMFLERMSQPYLEGEPVTGVAGGTAAKALGAHLRRTDAAILSRSSNLDAMVSPDDPVQKQGGL